MRAPSLARMAAVAAPRPDADPVTITHKPSFDIRISSDRFQELFRCSAIYHILAGNTCKSRNSRHAELVIVRSFLARLACRPADSSLVMAMAFPHHALQENTAS